MTELVLVDRDVTLAAAWREAFGDLENVRFHHGSIFDIPCDAIISPANSFGFMDGGIDLALSNRLGWQVQERVQEAIADRFAGELLVGQALIVPTDKPDFPYLIAAPTMRTPRVLGPDTVHPYLAMRAILLLLRDGAFEDGTPLAGRIRSIAIPGLGTGIGQVPAETCARQMRQAVDEILLGFAQRRLTWIEIRRHEQRLLW